MKKKIESLGKVLEILETIHQKTQSKCFGCFGKFSFKTHKDFSENGFEVREKFLWSIDDGIDTYVEITMCLEELGTPLEFSFGLDEGELKVWISTWYEGCLGSAKKINFEDVPNHPFVLSWQKFLEVHQLAEPDHVLWVGGSLPEIFDLEDGLDFFQKWFAWVEKYS